VPPGWQAEPVSNLPPDVEGAPPAGHGGPQVAFGKAIALVVVAVVLGIILLQVGSRSPQISATGTTTPTTTASGSTTTTKPVATTTTTTVPHSSVSVLVANGTTTPNAAGDFTKELQGQGWNMQPAADTTTPVSASAVYYAPGQQAAAATIAAGLGLKPTAVQPLTTSVPVSGTTGSDVVVVIGPDLAANLPS